MALPAQGFRSRVRPGTVQQRQRQLPGADALQGASLLGRATMDMVESVEQADERIAESQQRMAEAERRRQQQQQALDIAATMAEVQGDVARRVAELEREPAAGGEGHEQAVRESLDEGWNKVAAGLPPDPEMQARARAQYMEFSQRAGLRAESFEAAQRTIKAGGDWNRMSEALSVRLYNAPDAETLGEVLAQGAATIEALPYGEDQKATLLHEFRASMVNAMLTGAVDQEQFGAIQQVLDEGAFDDLLGGAEGKAAWSRRVAAGEQVLASREAALRNEEQRAALESLQVLEVRMDNGDWPSAAEIQLAVSQAQAAGVDQSDLLEFAYMADDAVRGRALQAFPTPALQADAEQLRQAINNGTASDEDRRNYRLLEAELDSRDAEAATSLRELAKSGPEGRMQAVMQLGQMEPQRRYQVAMDAGDAKLAIYAGLPPRMAQVAEEGSRLRAERPDDFLPPSGTGNRRSTGTGGRDGAEAVFRAAIGEDMVDQLGDAYGETLDAALDLMAGDVRRWDQARFLRAVQQVFGSTQRNDGTWQGGLHQMRGGSIVYLPPFMTGSSFEALVRGFEYEGATYEGGAPANPADIRRNFTPRHVRTVDGIEEYYMVNAEGGLLMRGTDEIFKLRISPRTRPATLPLGQQSRSGGTE